MSLKIRKRSSCSPSSTLKVSENPLQTHQTPDATTARRVEKYHEQTAAPNSQEKIGCGVIVGFSTWENTSSPDPDLVPQTPTLFPQVLTKMHTQHKHPRNPDGFKSWVSHRNQIIYFTFPTSLPSCFCPKIASYIFCIQIVITKITMWMDITNLEGNKRQ